jgi:signal transduction histidine kinase
MVKNALLATVLTALNVVLLERRAFGEFAILGQLPSWFARLYPDIPAEAVLLRPADASPFLANFLIDAESFWEKNRPGRLLSGPWSEAALNGEECFLEASAINTEGHKILALEFQRASIEQMRAIIQKAREHKLDHYRVLQEMQKKEILLSCIIHDLVQPLTALKGCLLLLAREQLSMKGKQLLDIGLQETATQERLIQNVLQTFTADVEAQKEIATDPQDLPDIAVCGKEVVVSMTPAFALNQVELRLDPNVDWLQDWRVVGEKSRLERVLMNLVENALRYSPRGSTVTIGVQQEQGSILTTVDDEGPGVPAELSPHLFRKFVQGSDKPGRGGLGLYFCRMTVEWWGGTVGYSPRGGRGSRFWFRLPRPLVS